MSACRREWRTTQIIVCAAAAGTVGLLALVNVRTAAEELSHLTSPFLAAGAYSHLCTAEDYTTGAWVYEPLATVAPGYTHCQLDRRQDCRTGDAPDAGWVTKYLWRPNNTRCSLRVFERDDFLRCMAGKRIVFLGDSITRNQQQSLQCMLLDGPEPERPWGDGWKVEYDSVYPAYGNASVNLVMSLLVTPEEIATVAPTTDLLVLGTGGPRGGAHWFPRTFSWVESTKHLVNDSFVWDSFSGGPEAVVAFFDEQVRLRVAALLYYAKPDATIVWRVPDVAHNFGAHQVDGPNSARHASCGGSEPGIGGLDNIVTWPAPYHYLRMLCCGTPRARASK